jgi:thiol-disulfide isomerase/thioredoxin
MEKSLLKRRQLLWYLGLGVVGVGGATALHQARNFRATTESTPISQIQPSVSPPLTTDKTKLPELQGINTWLNSEPLSIASLQGSVVLVQFWTFACINCQRTLPSLVKWHQQYASKGLKVVSVHTPEFAFERELNNVKQALGQHKITYPVAIDNDFQTWKAYKNEYWPHLFLADRQGNLVYDHIGEGAYTETEQKINQLLG